MDAQRREVRYLAPDTLEWEWTGRGHGDWVQWAFEADLDEYYADLRWDGWREEVTRVGTDQALALYPAPFSAEGADIAKASRKAVPVHEVWGVVHDFRRQLGIG